MVTPTAETAEILRSLNATFRFAHFGPTFEPLATDDTKVRQSKAGGVRCEIMDRTIGGEPYFSAVGSDEGTALEVAVRGALTAPKPMTPAQKAGSAAAAVASENENLKARIAELEAQVRAKAPITKLKELTHGN